MTASSDDTIKSLIKVPHNKVLKIMPRILPYLAQNVHVKTSEF